MVRMASCVNGEAVLMDDDLDDLDTGEKERLTPNSRLGKHETYLFEDDVCPPDC